MLLLVSCLTALFAGEFLFADKAGGPEAVPSGQYDQGTRVEEVPENSQLEAGKKFARYRRPMDIDNGFSSAFQEFRSSHFHAGFDLRTHQKTGYPVYAIADGRIVKIRIVRRGSGKGLYLKHDDGNTSIYFHLDRFSPALEALVKKVRRNTGKKYFGNYDLNKPLRFKRGQLIAYSGETGAGFPHLHLEIRDPQHYAVNPFKLIPFPDKRLPLLRSVLMRNRGNSLLNGRVGEERIRFKSMGGGRYRATRSPVVTGPFDILVNACDVSDTGRYVAPYAVSASIDGNPYFEITFDRFKWDDNNQLGFIYDMYYSSPSTYHFNLFFQQGFKLEKKNVELDQLLNSLAPGRHEITIRVTDNSSNVSTGQMTFYKVQEPVLHLTPTDVTHNLITLVVDKLEAEAADRITITFKNKSEKTIYSGNFKHRTIIEPKGFTLKGAFSGAAFLDFNFYKNGMLYFKKRFPVNHTWPADVTTVDFDTFINRDVVYIKMKSPAFTTGNLRLKVIQGQDAQTLPARAGGGNVFFSFTPRNFDNNAVLRFTLLEKGKLAAEVQETLFLVYLKKGFSQSCRYEEFRAYFDVKSVYEPKVLVLEETHYKASYPIESRQISLSPYFFPFLDKVYYTFRKKLPNPRQVGIFKYSPKSRRWSYRYTTYDGASATFKRKVRSSGTFALMRDISPPRIFFSKPKVKFKKSVRALYATIKDKGKGVNDARLGVYLNGGTADHEYDPDRRRLTVHDLTRLKIGKNLLKIVARDHGGNKNTKTMTFYLK
ncbi:MAG: M23 family metallopeptidase [bacterium]|nr:M23 family metallopeptidase [bacterium]